MNIEEIKMDHFENFEELIKTCKMWIREDDIDAYYRFFEFNCMKALITAYEKEKEKNKELNKLKGFEMLDIFNMGKQSSRQRIEFDYVDKEKIKAGIEEARKRYNDLHTKHLKDCGIAEQRELAKIEFGESLLKEE